MAIPHNLLSIKLPIKIKTKKELNQVITYFKYKESPQVIAQLEQKKTFHEKVKFLRFMGYAK